MGAIVSLPSLSRRVRARRLAAANGALFRPPHSFPAGRPYRTHNTRNIFSNNHRCTPPWDLESVRCIVKGVANNPTVTYAKLCSKYATLRDPSKKSGARAATEERARESYKTFLLGRGGTLLNHSRLDKKSRNMWCEPKRDKSYTLENRRVSCNYLIENNYGRTQVYKYNPKHTNKIKKGSGDFDTTVTVAGICLSSTLEDACTKKNTVVASEGLDAAAERFSDSEKCAVFSTCFKAEPADGDAQKWRDLYTKFHATFINYLPKPLDTCGLFPPNGDQKTGLTISCRDMKSKGEDLGMGDFGVTTMATVGNKRVVVKTAQDSLNARKTLYKELMVGNAACSLVAPCAKGTPVVTYMGCALRRGYCRMLSIARARFYSFSRSLSLVAAAMLW